ncbi:hypothetical protein EMGBD4_08760 [Verrucomicrobiota bacterium]|nr:hypothetical protein EMGBD4_08760 [Verrucomicrobiota bacterium]
MKTLIAPLLVLLAGHLPVGAADQKIEETARRLFKSHADAVITVRATVALTMTAGDAPSQSRDQSVEELGTVVTAQGLVVISASSIDPATAMDGRTVNMRGAPVKLAVTSEVKEPASSWPTAPKSPPPSFIRIAT